MEICVERLTALFFLVIGLSHILPLGGFIVAGIFSVALAGVILYPLL